MRIALIAPLVTPIREPQQGGSQAVVADLAHGLQDRGHAVDVYAATGSTIPGVTMVDTGVRAESLAALLYRADGREVADNGIGEPAFRKVFDAIKGVRYDVVHNHAFDAPAVRGAMGVDWPVVHTLHLPPEPVMAAALNQALRAARPPTIAAVSASSAAGWQRLTRIHAVLRNGVPVDQVPWSKDTGHGLLFAGRFSAEKGAADAIAIADRAGLPIHLYGEPYDSNYFREQIEPHKGRPGVTIHGGVPRPQLWRAMAGALAVLCPAKWAEPFGMAAAEAQAAGTPVIAYDAGALAGVILQEKTGFLVPAGDVDAAAQATATVRSIRRVDCRRHAEASLNLRETIAAHERLYQEVNTSKSAVSRA